MEDLRNILEEYDTSNALSIIADLVEPRFQYPCLESSAGLEEAIKLRRIAKDVEQLEVMDGELKQGVAA